MRPLRLPAGKEKSVEVQIEIEDVLNPYDYTTDIAKTVIHKKLPDGQLGQCG
ncbi:hypothetical protein [Algoriphagus sp. A40]|uniref:hypothetical protein n=1 Tax=Algoriphagus sp. A40 TaxID=1945863 RepID=UPI001439AABA|nr:hypothetical protein [Algoriphagus sp. A40]